MRRSSMLFALAFLVVLAGAAPVQAQLACTEPDLVALVFDNGDVNFTPTLFTPFNMHLVLLNPSLPGADAFEVQVDVPNYTASFFKLSEQLPPGCINVGDSTGSSMWYFIAGFPTPLPPVSGQVTLVTWSLMAHANPGQYDIYLGPLDLPLTPSIPGHAAYNYTYPGGPVLQPMYSVAGDYDEPAARLWPATPLDHCETTVIPAFTVTIAGEGELIVAGAASNANDGFDPGLDLTDPSPLLTFPRPAWGGNFERDIRGSYDPTQAVKTWTFTASPATGASDDAQVDLAFTPSFGAESGIDLLLRDHVTGNTVDLRSQGLYYSYTGAATRMFSLSIGSVPPPDPSLVVDIAVACGAYSDPLTRAATNAQATDGFDAAFDFPEPAPPPGNYVSASFEQGGWPLGPRFSTDVRALFNPDQTSRVWPLMVETDRAGSVVLTFAPNFGEMDGIDLQLRDLSTGQTFDLFPSLSYMFQNYGSPTARHFELIIGASAPPDLVPAFRALPAGWSMVGLPLAPPAGDDTMGEVLLDPSPGFAYAFTFHRYLGYQSVPAATTARTGTGYWLGTSAGFNWTMNGTRSLDGVNVPLSNGWNLVGNANWFPGPFEGLRVIHAGTTYNWLSAVGAGLVSADVQSWNPTLAAYYVALDLQPWNAYWINALADDITLRFQWQNFMQIPARLAAPPPADKAGTGSWQSDLVLTDAGERTQSITFGVDVAATAGFDAAFDRPMPPAAPGGGASLSFQHPEWELAAGNSFTRDLVGPGEEPVRWTVSIAAPATGTATLAWNPADWPEGTDYQLYFPHENRVVVMSMRARTSLAVEVGAQPLTVVIRTPDLTSGVDGPSPAGDYTLAAQPNPFNPATTVSFNLPQRGRAEVRIYSVRGELVDVLGGGTYEAGLHREVWHGRDRAGRDVPSGAYFGRLHVDGHPLGQVIRMSLVR
jgi:hypothetical protein